MLPATVRRIRAVEDAHLRGLLWSSDSDAPELDKICRLALWEEMLAAAECPDGDLLPSLCRGMPIIGDVARSRRWAPLQSGAALSEEDLRSRAWEVRRKIIARISSTAITQHSVKAWESTISDRDEGSSLGPFYEEAGSMRRRRSPKWWERSTGSLPRGSANYQFDQRGDSDHRKQIGPSLHRPQRGDRQVLSMDGPRLVVGCLTSVEHVQFSEPVSQSFIDFWIPRKTQSL